MTERTKRIRVLHSISGLHRQGPVFQLYNLIKYMDNERFSNTILNLSPKATSPLETEFSDLGVNVYSLQDSRTVGVLHGAHLFRKFLRNHPVDIIHASDLRSSLITTFRPQNVRQLITRREAFLKARITDFGLILGAIIEALHSTSCRRADRVVAVSRFVQQSAGRLKRTGIDVILNGVDTRKFVPVSSVHRREMKNRLHLPHDRTIFVTAGFLNRRKDPLTIVKGFLLSKVSNQSLLILLGSGPLRRKCEQLANGHPNVRFMGFVNNVLEYLQASEFFVLSSLYEGCPNAAMEAMACGLPVILSDIQPHLEIMRLNMQAGKLFKTKDSNSLAKRMEEIDNSDYSLLRSSALGIIREYLNARRMAAQYEAVYNEIYKSHSISEK